MTALQAIFDLLHLYGLEAFKVDASAPSGSDDDESKETEDEEEQEEEDDKEEQQNKSAANSAVAILSRLLESEVSICKFLVLELPWVGDLKFWHIWKT